MKTSSWNGLDVGNGGAKWRLTNWSTGFAVDLMNNVIVDTNVLVYIYSGVPNIGRTYAGLLDDLSANCNLGGIYGTPHIFTVFFIEV